jgi:signal transduction histidine kinase
MVQQKFVDSSRLLKSRTRFWWLGVVAFSAILFANFTWLFPTLNELEQNSVTLYSAVGESSRARIESFFETQERSIQSAIDLIGAKRLSPREAIASLFKEATAIEEVLILNENGKPVVHTHRFILLEEDDKLDFLGTDLFEASIRGQKYRSPVSVSGASEPIITIAFPMKTESGLAAFVATMNLKIISNAVQEVAEITGEDDATSVFVVDANGSVVAHTDPSFVLRQVNLFSDPFVNRALNGEKVDTTQMEFAGLESGGKEVFAVALPLNINNWAIVVEQERSVAIPSYGRIFTIGALSIVVELLLVLLVVLNYRKLVYSAGLLLEERNHREAILNNLTDGIVEYDSNSRIILINPRAEDLLQIRFSEIQNKVITPDTANKEPHLRGLVELMYPALAAYASSVKDIPDSNAKIMSVHISKLDLRLAVTLTQVFDNQNQLVGFLKIIHDVSREELISRVKSEFVSVVAHQLRTPLSAVKWSMRLLLDGDIGELTIKQLEVLQRGYNTNERMIKLVNDLLNAARIEEGKFGYEFKEIDLVSFFEKLIDGYKLEAKRRGLDLLFVKEIDNLLDAYVDEERLTLAINNLLDNAVKYTEPGGKIKLKLGKSGNFAEIEISDNGVGIPNKEIKRVFSKFFRASNVTRLETDGTGLGLFIVRNIVKRHGGEISFVSEEKKGTTFTITLPLLKELVPKEEKKTFNEVSNILS